MKLTIYFAKCEILLFVSKNSHKLYFCHFYPFVISFNALKSLGFSFYINLNDGKEITEAFLINIFLKMPYSVVCIVIFHPCSNIRKKVLFNV